MRRWRLFVIAVISFIGVTEGVFFKKSLSLFLCGLLSFNSTICYINFNDGRVNAAISSIKNDYKINIPVNGHDKSNPENFPLNRDLPISPETDLKLDIPAQIAIPPIIRPAEVNVYLQNALPKDFRISNQIPFRSGKQEILLVSPSTGAEQLYTFNLPGASSFQLFEVEYKKVSAIDFSNLTSTNSLVVNPEQIKSVLNKFKINFANNSLSKVTLSDGTTADFSAGQAVIKTPNGQQVEIIQISHNEFNNTVLSRKLNKISKNQSNFIAKSSESSCQAAVSSSLNGISDNLGQWGNKLTTSNSATTKSIGWALAFGSGAMKSNISSKNPMLQEVNCRPPVQCEEQRVSGGSEIRTDLFQVAKGTNRKVKLDFEFYEIPDRLELYFDGKQIFGVGPQPGKGAQSFDLPSQAEYVGVKLIGNDDIKTRWWYVISCSGSVIADVPLSGSVTRDESSFPPCNGRLTFEAEGIECPDTKKKCHRYHSRKPHVPDGNSGVTIGRGYDLKRKTPEKIKTDLVNIGLSPEDADVYAKAGCKINPKTKECNPQYQGKNAQKFINENQDKLIEISSEQQLKLFKVTYSELETDVKRISTNEKDKWGDVKWEKLDTRIKEIILDLRFRGDYTPETRKQIQKHLVDNDFKAFKEAMQDEKFWRETNKPVVPEDRFKRRNEYLEKDIDKDCKS
jgi:hypothetical protein